MRIWIVNTVNYQVVNMLGISLNDVCQFTEMKFDMLSPLQHLFQIDHIYVNWFHLQNFRLATVFPTRDICHVLFCRLEYTFLTAFVIIYLCIGMIFALQAIRFFSCVFVCIFVCGRVNKVMRNIHKYSMFFFCIW